MTHRLKIAMVMAAGFGTRMEDLTEDLPKPLLPLNEDRIIEVLLRKLAAAGLERVVINLHYLPEVVKKLLNKDYGVEICFSAEPELLGSGGGIANAEHYFAGEDILVVNADTLCEIDVQAFYRAHCASGKLASMAALPSRNTRDYGLILYDDQLQLREFMLRGQELYTDLNSAIFIGYQVLTPAARAYLAPVNQSVISAFYKKAMPNGEVGIYPFAGEWIDIGTKTFYEQLVRKVQTGEVSLQRFINAAQGA